MNAFITWHPNFIPTFPIDLRRNPSVMSRPTKTADILRKQPTFCDATTGFPREMTSEKKVPKFHTDDVSLPRSGLSLLIGSRKFPTLHDQSGAPLRSGKRHVNGMLSGWFSNSTGTSVDYGVRKPNNWLDQRQSDNLGTGSRIQCFPRAFCARSSDVNSRGNQ